MTHTFGIGVIGMGWMGQVHSRSYRQIPDRFREAEYPAAAGDLQRQCRSPRNGLASNDLALSNRPRIGTEVIEHPDVDVVNIAAPNGLHLKMVRAAAAAGKHIFCEKPVGKDPAETMLCEQAAREAGVQIICGLQLSLGTAGTIYQTTHQKW